MPPSSLPLRFFIQNRHGLKIRVCVYLPIGEKTIHDVMGSHVGPELVAREDSYSKAPSSGASAQSQKAHKKLVFIMPGLGSHHAKPEFEAIAEIFTNHGYTAVSFDPTHSFGESEGEYADATFTNYAEDLEDFIEWARSKRSGDAQINSTLLSFYTEPFVLVGHSLGAMSVTRYAEKFPERVKALAPLSTPVAGKLSLEVRSKEEVEKWKALGYQDTVRSNGSVKRLKWSHMEDRLKYNMLDQASNITMPLLMLVGENDPTTPPKHQQLLFDAVSTKAGDKELHIIKNANHNIGAPETLTQVKAIFENWICKIDEVSD